MLEDLEASAPTSTLCPMPTAPEEPFPTAGPLVCYDLKFNKTTYSNPYYDDTMMTFRPLRCNLLCQLLLTTDNPRIASLFKSCIVTFYMYVVACLINARVKCKARVQSRLASMAQFVLCQNVMGNQN